MMNECISFVRWKTLRVSNEFIFLNTYILLAAHPASIKSTSIDGKN